MKRKALEDEIDVIEDEKEGKRKRNRRQKEEKRA